jgi:hypothetical protein
MLAFVRSYKLTLTGGDVAAENVIVYTQPG